MSATTVHPGGIKTNIAHRARLSDSLAALSDGRADGPGDFNKALRMPPEKAARLILAAVSKNRRRALIGTDAKVLDLLSRLPAGVSQRALIAGGQAPHLNPLGVRHFRCSAVPTGPRQPEPAGCLTPECSGHPGGTPPRAFADERHERHGAEVLDHRVVAGSTNPQERSGGRCARPGRSCAHRRPVGPPASPAPRWRPR